MEIALFLALLTSSLALPLTSLGENWAVLVSGSYTWMNYRHQVRSCLRDVLWIQMEALFLFRRMFITRIS